MRLTVILVHGMRCLLRSRGHQHWCIQRTLVVELLEDLFEHFHLPMR